MRELRCPLPSPLLQANTWPVAGVVEDTRLLGQRQRKALPLTATVQTRASALVLALGAQPSPGSHKEGQPTPACTAGCGLCYKGETPKFRKPKSL